MKKIIGYLKRFKKKIVRFVFADELRELDDLKNQLHKSTIRCGTQADRIEKLISSMGITADINIGGHSPSWAVLSLQGETTEMIRFQYLNDRDLNYIRELFSQFEERDRKVDCAPHMKGWIIGKKGRRNI